MRTKFHSSFRIMRKMLLANLLGYKRLNTEQSTNHGMNSENPRDKSEMFPIFSPFFSREMFST